MKRKQDSNMNEICSVTKKGKKRDGFRRGERISQDFLNEVSQNLFSLRSRVKKLRWGKRFEKTDVFVNNSKNDPCRVIFKDTVSYFTIGVFPRADFPNEKGRLSQLFPSLEYACEAQELIVKLLNSFFFEFDSTGLENCLPSIFIGNVDLYISTLQHSLFQILGARPSQVVRDPYLSTNESSLIKSPLSPTPSQLESDSDSLLDDLISLDNFHYT